MVEGGRIDHAHHVGNAFNALSDTVELSSAVDVALKATSPEDTLIIVTADHGHVFTMAGYPKRGNPILGKVVSPGKKSPPWRRIIYPTRRWDMPMDVAIDIWGQKQMLIEVITCMVLWVEPILLR